MATRQRYTRVGTDEDSHDAADAAENSKQARRELVETLSNKMHAAVWVGLAGFCIYYTDMPRTVLYDERVRRWALDASVVFGSIVFAIGVYLTIYLPYIAKIDLKWNVYCPRMIPAATICGILSMILFGISMWPVWGLLTPIIIALLFMGFLFSAHFVPLP